MVLTQIGLLIVCSGCLSLARPTEGNVLYCNVTGVKENVMAQVTMATHQVQQLLEVYCSLAVVNSKMNNSICVNFAREQEEIYQQDLPKVNLPCTKNYSDVSAMVQAQLNHLLLAVRARIHLTQQVWEFEKEKCQATFLQFEETWFCNTPQSSEEQRSCCRIKSSISLFGNAMENLKEVIKNEICSCHMTPDLSSKTTVQDPVLTESDRRLYNLAAIFSNLRLFQLIKIQLDDITRFPY